MALRYLKKHDLKFFVFFWLNSSAGPSNTQIPSCDQTHLQRLVAPPLNGTVADLKGVMGDSERNGISARPANSRKRVRKTANPELACRGGSSSTTNGLGGELEMRQGPHKDHCYSLQPTGSQGNIVERPHAKRKAPEREELAADKSELQGTLWAQQWQRWADSMLELTNVLCVWHVWDISVSNMTVDFQEITSVRGQPSRSITGEAVMAVSSVVTIFGTLLLRNLKKKNTTKLTFRLNTIPFLNLGEVSLLVFPNMLKCKIIMWLISCDNFADKLVEQAGACS